VGRASKRKKEQRQTGGPNLRRINQETRTQAVVTRSAFGLDAMVQLAGERVTRRNLALEAWLTDAEPEPTELPPWPEGSLGHRLLAGTRLWEAQDAPSLLTARIPDAATIDPDPAHWTIAAEALIRALVFDGLTLEHPAVRAVLEPLTSVAEDEVEYMQDDDEEVGFPVMDGPVLLIGRALTETVWAIAGNDSLADVGGALESALDGAVPGLEADSLVGALLPVPSDSDNPLELLIVDGEVRPRDILPVGLLVLSALARLGQSSSDSILDPPQDPK
jgi:hypothetical protein